MLATSSIAKGAMVGGHFLSAKALVFLTGGFALKVMIAYVIAGNGYGEDRRLYLRKAEQSLKREWRGTPNPLETEAHKRGAILHDIRSLRVKAEKGWRSLDDLKALLRVMRASTIPLLEDGANAAYEAVESFVTSGADSVRSAWSKLTKEV